MILGKFLMGKLCFGSNIATFIGWQPPFQQAGPWHILFEGIWPPVRRRGGKFGAIPLADSMGRSKDGKHRSMPSKQWSCSELEKGNQQMLKVKKEAEKEQDLLRKVQENKNHWVICRW